MCCNTVSIMSLKLTICQIPRLEKEKSALQLEARDAQTAADRLANEKAAAEKEHKLTLAALGDVQVGGIQKLLKIDTKSNNCE